MKKSIPISLIICLLYVEALTGQNLFVKRLWANLGSGNAYIQEARKIIRTPDNNFLVAGYMVRSSTSLERDGLVMKISPSGNVIWARRYGGTTSNTSSNWEEFYDVAYVGGYYYCVGYTRSVIPGASTTSSNVLANIFLVKITTVGNIVWAKSIGNPLVDTTGTNGNDIGLRVIASSQGGVMVVARINSGSATNQNSAVLWVDSDAKTHWAYQYDWPGNASGNELTYGICKDGALTYVVGGWLETFGSISGGLLYKIDQNGGLIWDQNTTCSPSTAFESQYFGFFNNRNKKIYTTDFYTESNSTIREINVCTNLSEDGNVPPSGSIPQVKRFHYGTAGSSNNNNNRAYIFPVGDGQHEFVLAAYNLATPSLNTTRYATVISANTDLAYQWSKKVGVLNANNQINDMITCDGDHRDLIGVGTVSWSTGLKDILITRINYSDTVQTCEVVDDINNSNLSATNTPLSLQRINLKTSGCGSYCWVNDETIGSVFVQSVGIDSTTDCTDNTFSQQSQLSYISANECDGDNCLKNLSFSFAKTPKEVYFEMTDAKGDYVYQRFFGNKSQLVQGYKFADMTLANGDYIWEIQAVYDDVQGIERKMGQFKIE